MLSTVWCHLSCEALVRKLGDEGKTFLHLIEKTKVKQQDDGSWHYQMFFNGIFIHIIHLHRQSVHKLTF